MDSLYEKSLRTLELPAVLEMLASHAGSEAAKEQCRTLRPAETAAEISRALAETEAAKQKLILNTAPSFSGIRDVRNSLARADLGGSLNPRELLDVASLLSCARNVQNYAKAEHESTSCINYLFHALHANKYLEEKINTAIPAEDEISDFASRDLQDIRRKIRAASARVRETLQKIISSPSYAKALQEPIITMRSDRYVVPVRADHKNDIPGLVHDISSSGATVFIEPMGAVKANNEIRELRAKEKQEIERILMELSAECASFRDDITSDFTILVQLDFIFAKAKLSYDLDCCAPEITEHTLSLIRARHPLLPKGTAVPITVQLGEGFDTLVITGPNTGGKTVTLKTIGLLITMAACGLHIPAGDLSSVPVLHEILADIGDEQSIEQNLSTFSAHMTNTVQMLSHCDKNVLLLFDELGAGTDPVEGAALAVSIIEHARSAGALIAATTHYSELKVYATTRPGVQNASCEFDVETLRPTYRLLIGIPGKSNAFAISKRLGLDEAIIKDAKSRVGTDAASMEDVLEKLEQQRQALDKEKLEIARLHREAEENTKKSAFLKNELSVRLEKADLKTKREAERILEDARRQAEAVFDELDRIRKLEDTEPDHKKVNEARAQLRKMLNEAEEALSETVAEPEPEVQNARPIRVGDTVQLRNLGTKATVLSVSPDGTLQLQAGIMKISAKEKEVILTDSPHVEVKKRPEAKGITLRAAISPEIDLRGMMTDEALLVLDRYIDSAAMSKLNEVRIIHGKGTGALRAAVQQSLKKNKLVKSYRLGIYGEGETGVTIATLKD